MAPEHQRTRTPKHCTMAPEDYSTKASWHQSTMALHWVWPSVLTSPRQMYSTGTFYTLLFLLQQVQWWHWWPLYLSLLHQLQYCASGAIGSQCPWLHFTAVVALVGRPISLQWSALASLQANNNNVHVNGDNYQHRHYHHHHTHHPHHDHHNYDDYDNNPWPHYKPTITMYIVHVNGDNHHHGHHQTHLPHHRQTVDADKDRNHLHYKPTITMYMLMGTINIIIIINLIFLIIIIITLIMMMMIISIGLTTSQQ